MNISVDLVKQLRELTAASLKDCKDCLVEANGDLELAKELLKKKGLASAMKKGDRETKEGKIGHLVKDGKLAIVKLGCETDFVAKNGLFDHLIATILNEVIDNEVQSFDALDDNKKEHLNTIVAEVVGKLGENMKIIELFVKKLPSSEVFVYTHAGSKLVSAVFYNPLSQEAEDVVKKVALQVAAMDPAHLSTESIPVDELEKMKTDFEIEVKESGKPEAVIPNIVAGKLNKRYTEIVLMEQGYMGDEVSKIKHIVEGKAEIIGFERIAFAN